MVGLLAQRACLQVAPTKSAREYAEGRYHNGDYKDLCRHRTNSVCFTDAIISNAAFAALILIK
jgi:hypothetical protein